jgi:hypothetical protein
MIVWKVGACLVCGKCNLCLWCKLGGNFCVIFNLFLCSGRAVGLRTVFPTFYKLCCVMQIGRPLHIVTICCDEPYFIDDSCDVECCGHVFILTLAMSLIIGTTCCFYQLLTSLAPVPLTSIGVVINILIQILSH